MTLRAGWLFGCVVLLISVGCETTPSRFDEQGVSGPGGKGATSAELYANLAAEYLSRGQLEIALTKGKQALAADRGNANANNVMGLIYQRLGEPNQAERHFERALRVEPSNPYYLNAFGGFLCKQGRYEEAEKRFSLAAANPLNRSPEIALTNAGTCALRQPEGLSKAETFFRRALESNSKFPPALIQMASLSLENGEPLSARAYVQRFEAVAPHTARSLWLAIQAERALGDEVAAAKYEMSLRSRFPDSTEIQFLRESRQP
jgi:type IV pilus assembly protein PilF